MMPRWSTMNGPKQPLRAYYVLTDSKAATPGRRYVLEIIGAGDGIRTHDPNLGKVVLYP